MARWRNYFSQILTVHEVKDVRQLEIHTVEPLVPELSAFEVELGIEKLKNHKSPSIDQIPAELIKARSTKICCEIHKLTNCIWRNCLRSGRSLLLYQPIGRLIKQTVVII